MGQGIAGIINISPTGAMCIYFENTLSPQWADRRRLVASFLLNLNCPNIHNDIRFVVTLGQYRHSHTLTHTHLYLLTPLLLLSGKFLLVFINFLTLVSFNASSL